jgi:hypothetical protein
LVVYYIPFPLAVYDDDDVLGVDVNELLPELSVLSSMSPNEQAGISGRKFK